jgi:hypothetical protein
VDYIINLFFPLSCFLFPKTDGLCLFLFFLEKNVQKLFW